MPSTVPRTASASLDSSTNWGWCRRPARPHARSTRPSVSRRRSAIRCSCARRALRAQTKALAGALGVVGLINVQFAIRNDAVYVLEVNPRASRTIPFVSKAIGVPLAKVATRAMLGHPVSAIASVEAREPDHIAVKESVFPFIKFPGVDVVLGPEMKSTGEVMGIDHDFRKAYLKAQVAAGSTLPTSGKVFTSVKNRA